MPPHRSASLRAALAPPCPGATARVTSPSAGCPALAAGRRTRRANAPHRSRSCWRRLNRCSQPRPLRSAGEHPAPWLQDVRTYSQTSLRYVREYVRSCPAGPARSASARLRHVGPAALFAPGEHLAQTGLPGTPNPGKPAEKQTLELALHLLRNLAAELLDGPDAEAHCQAASGEAAP